MNGASIDRIVVQSTPAKNGCSLISCAPFRPRRVSGDVKNLQKGNDKGQLLVLAAWSHIIHLPPDHVLGLGA